MSNETSDDPLSEQCAALPPSQRGVFDVAAHLTWIAALTLAKTEWIAALKKELNTEA